MGAARALGADVPGEVSEDLEGRFEREMAEQGGYFTAVIVTGQKLAEAAA